MKSREIYIRILNGLIVLLLVLGIVGVFFRFLEKREYDGQNSQIAVIMDFTDTVSMTNGINIEYDMRVFASSGFSAVMMEPEVDAYDKDTLEMLRSSGLAIGLLPGNEFSPTSYASNYLTLGANFPLLILDSVPSSPDLPEMSAAGISIASIIGNEFRLPEGYDRIVSLLRFAPQLETDEEGRYIYGTLVDELADYAVNDGVRVFYLSIFTDTDGEPILDISVYSALLRGLAPELSRHGLELGADFSSMFVDSSTVWVLFISLAFCALLLIFISGVRRLPAKIGLIILGVLCIAVIVLFFVNNALCRDIMSIVGHLLSPTLAVYYVVSCCRALHLSNGNRSVSSVYFYTMLHLVLAAAVSAVIALAAGLINISQLFSLPSGIGTATWLVTLLYTAVMLFHLLYHEKGNTVSDYLSVIYLSIFRKKARTAAIVLIAITAVLLYVFVMLPSPYSLGDRLTEFLANYLIVTPAIGDYLIGYPCMAAALVICARRMRAVAWPLVLISCIPFLSTSSYYASPTLSLTHLLCHSGVTLVFGFVIAMLIALILSLIIWLVKLRPSKNWYVY